MCCFLLQDTKLRCVCWRAGRELVCVLSSTGHETEMCVLACREGAGVCVVFYRT